VIKIIYVWRNTGKELEVVYKTNDFKDAFEYAKKLAQKGNRSFLTASSDKSLYCKYKKRRLFEYDKNI